MPRDAAYELTAAEKRDLIKLINEGKPLPEKYRFILFADKREAELVWNGKSREVCTTILPFQSLEHIDEPRKEKGASGELALDTAGRQLKGWTNKLIWGDNDELTGPVCRVRGVLDRHPVRDLAGRCHRAKGGGTAIRQEPRPPRQPCRLLQLLQAALDEGGAGV